MSVQKSHHRCERCGLRSPVTQLSPFEFAYDCPCPRGSGVISWCHENPAPEFIKTPQVVKSTQLTQGRLFVESTT